MKLRKLTLVCAMLGATALLAGCATPHSNLVLDPVGPPPHGQNPELSDGTLLVFSAFEPTPDPISRPYRRMYTDYKILSADGKKVVQSVHNDNGVMLEGPKAVSLPVGTYRVVARANSYGVVTVPVIIQPGQSTLVHLEGSVWWPNPKVIAGSNPVCLPGNEIVGWRATELAH